jgi:hypothetical protein
MNLIELLFQNEVLRGEFEPKGKELTGTFRKKEYKNFILLSPS